VRKIDAVLGNWQPVAPRFTTQMEQFHAYRSAAARCR
jgi:hypothetical protein